MLQTITPEQAGISSNYVAEFIRSLERKGVCMHSVLLMKGSDIFAEYYWAPFDRDTCHRMYSQTKSYVAVAIGLLEEDGRLCLDDPIAKYFPEKIERELPDYLAGQTIRQMLTMETCGATPSWFTHSDPDRTHLYFAENAAAIPAGMRFSYDSPGSQVLCALVEKLAGQPMFDFMYRRIFRHLDAFHTAKILKTKTEDSFGDSALVCTTRDMAAFARFVMNYGVWEGKRLMNGEYLRAATSRQVDNHDSAFEEMFSRGYGYQIWRVDYNGFAFNGMGCQFTFCFPDQDLIFCCTADNQGYGCAKSIITYSLYDYIMEHLQDHPLPEDPQACARARSMEGDRKLFALRSWCAGGFARELEGRVYRCQDNPTGITRFSFRFDETGEGELHYTNAQGDKVLAFGLDKNVFTRFPQLGYSDVHTCLPSADPGFMYRCAVSAAWAEEKKLLLKVQIIDDFLGNLLAIFSFREDYATVTMVKTAEAFLEEYHGEFVAFLEQ